MQPLRVALGERSYPIHIGAGVLGDAALYAPHARGRRVAVVTNAVVQPLYLARVRAALEKAGAEPLTVLVADGEQAKSWQTLDRVYDALLGARLGRDALLVALGGGVIGDLTGFAAATYQRGIPYLQLPTTLLAQVDSSVGGKTAINHARGKNMVGAFHQPLAVIADVATLDSLPDRELRAGIAEVIKHGLILDLAFLEWLEANLEKLLAREPGALQHAVRRSCELKAQVVAADERRRRRIERCRGYNKRADVKLTLAENSRDRLPRETSLQKSTRRASIGLTELAHRVFNKIKCGHSGSGRNEDARIALRIFDPRLPKHLRGPLKRLRNRHIIREPGFRHRSPSPPAGSPDVP